MRHPTRWAGAYALVAAILATAFAVAILSGPYRAVQRSDYMTYQTAARIVVEGRGDCLYSVACQSQAQHELIGDEPSFPRGALPFTSPPWLAALVLPLATLPLPVAFGAFTLLSLLLLALATWRLAWGDAGTRLVAVVLVLSAWPTTMGAIRGQSTLAAAALLGLSASASMASAETRAGALAGLAALKPTLLPLWLIRLVVERRWRSLAFAAAVVAGLVAVAALLVSPRAVAEYPAYLLNLAASSDAIGVHVDQMINWRGAAVRLGAGELLVAIGVVLTLIAVALAWWWARGSPRSMALAAATAFVATPLVIPHANQHEAIVATLGLLIAIGALQELRLRLATAAICLQAALWVGPLLTEQASAWLLFGTLLACLIVLLALCLRERRRYFRPVMVRPGTD